MVPSRAACHHATIPARADVTAGDVTAHHASKHPVNRLHVNRLHVNRLHVNRLGAMPLIHDRIGHQIARHSNAKMPGQPSAAQTADQTADLTELGRLTVHVTIVARIVPTKATARRPASLTTSPPSCANPP
jgi:hypothetical protein